MTITDLTGGGIETKIWIWNACGVMTATKSSGDGPQMKTLEDLVCSSSLAGELQQYSLLLSAVNIFFSLTAFLGNSLIFVALHKISSLHAPSKLLYRCLATTDLLVGLVSQPLVATLWISVVHEQWRLCRFAWEATSISGYGLWWQPWAWTDFWPCCWGWDTNKL